METQKYCVYNQTRECFLSFGVTRVDTVIEPLIGLIKKLATYADTGLWLIPYRGIPVVQGFSPVDLIYLDEDYRVIQTVESFLITVLIEPLKPQAASTLVLPVHTIYSSQTQFGDQLAICDVGEMGRRLERLSSPIGRVPNTHNTGARVEQSSSNNGSALPLSGDRFAQMQRAIQQLKGREGVESIARKKDSLVTRFFRWLTPDRRRARRHPLPGLVAHYLTGGAPHAYRVGDISSTGLHLLTDERWLPGTMILMTLQRTNTDGEDPEDWISVQTKVVRWSSGGLGLAFVSTRFVVPNNGETLANSGTDKTPLERFLQRLKLTECEE